MNLSTAMMIRTQVQGTYKDKNSTPSVNLLTQMNMIYKTYYKKQTIIHTSRCYTNYQEIKKPQCMKTRCKYIRKLRILQQWKFMNCF